MVHKKQNSLDLALAYIAKHPTRKIFPIKRGAKTPPLIQNNLVDASNDPVQITAWHTKNPGCNWGLALKASWIIVIDVDRKAGKHGQETFDTHTAEHEGGFPITETVSTPSGGLHYYYEGEHTFALGTNGFGLDIDSPNYVLIPGCTLADGTKYEDVTADGAAIVPAPAWFKNYLSAKPKSAKAGAEPIADLDKPEQIASMIEWLKYDAPDAIEGRGGDITTVKVAMRLRDEGISQTKAFELMSKHYNTVGTCDPLWDYAALETKVRNGFEYASLKAPGELTEEGQNNPDVQAKAATEAVAEFAVDPVPEIVHAPDVQARIADQKQDRKHLAKRARRKIKLDMSDPVRMIIETQNALIVDTAHDPLFRRGPSVVRLNQNVSDDDAENTPKGLRRRRGALTIREVEIDYLVTRIAQSIDYYKPELQKAPSTGKVGRPKKGSTPAAPAAPIWVDVSVQCPRSLINQLLAAETLHKLPWLEAIIEAPTLNADGTILSKPGYDPKNALYFDMRSMLKMPSFKEKPDIEDAKRGLEVLKDLLNEFAFADDISRSVALAAILTALVRTMLTIAPVFLIDAPGQSNGKTLLADIIGMIATGRGTGASQWANTTEEQRKAIGTILVAGDSVVNFDNITMPIGGPSLCGVLTSTNFKDRLLGEHTQISLPTFVTWLFTGNNMTIKDDMATRAMRCRLDAKCEFPDQRSFERKDLLGHAAEHRAELVHAALTVVQAYILAGKPKPEGGGSKGRFGGWGDYIADALVWCGEPNPTDSRESIVAEDPVRIYRGELLQTWVEAFGHKWATAGMIELSAVGTFIDELEPGNAHVSKIHIWSKLKPFEDQIIGGMILQRIKGDNKRHKSQWRVQHSPDNQPKPWE